MAAGLRQIAADVRSGRRRAAELCRDAIERIEQLDPKLRAFTQVLADEARAQAEAIDRRVAAGEDPGPLAGVPVAVKDNICTRNGRTTCASRMLEQYRSPFDATVVERLAAAGAVVVGKTNLDEFAMGSSCENSPFGPTRNPHDPARVAGGSSGGSAAAVAAGMVPAALGSDTGGSIRLPAAFCGVVGLKPSYGRVSRWGLVAYASSLDQIGPIAASVEDVAVLLSVIAGHDPRDSTSVDRPVEDYPAALEEAALAQAARTLRVGVPREYLAEGLDAQIAEAIDTATRELAAAGAEIVEISLPHTQYGVAAYYLIATAECSSNLARFDGVHYGRRAEGADTIEALYARSRAEGFGDEVKRRIMLGTFALSAGYYEAYYDQASRVRRKICEDFTAAFERADVLIGPTAATAAFELGEKLDDPLAMYLTDVYTIPANLAGLPAISLPAGLNDDGLPVGVQVLARPFDEARLLQTAALLERIFGTIATT